MTTALFTVPIVGMLAWLTLVALGVWRYHGAIAERRQHAERYRGRVLKDAEALDATLIEQLLDAIRPDDLLRNYLKNRAQLVSGLSLENPANWKNDDLNDLVAQRFHDDVQQDRRRLWIFVAISLATCLGMILVIAAVLYHFQRDNDTTANPALALPVPTFSVPPVTPDPDIAPPFHDPTLQSAPDHTKQPAANALDSEEADEVPQRNDTSSNSAFLRPAKRGPQSPRQSYEPPA
jgi:hypothetical protein